jgi:hypothetical protein
MGDALAEPHRVDERSGEKVTSAFAPDLDEVRAWLKKMIAALRFVEMVTAGLDVFLASTGRSTGRACRPRRCSSYRWSKVLTRQQHPNYQKYRPDYSFKHFLPTKRSPGEQTPDK